jgi:hypothetical protein
MFNMNWSEENHNVGLDVTILDAEYYISFHSSRADSQVSMHTSRKDSGFNTWYSPVRYQDAFLDLLNLAIAREGFPIKFECNYASLSVSDMRNGHNVRIKIIPGYREPQFEITIDDINMPPIRGIAALPFLQACSPPQDANELDFMRKLAEYKLDPAKHNKFDVKKLERAYRARSRISPEKLAETTQAAHAAIQRYVDLAAEQFAGYYRIFELEDAVVYATRYSWRDCLVVSKDEVHPRFYVETRMTRVTLGKCITYNRLPDSFKRRYTKSLTCDRFRGYLRLGKPNVISSVITDEEYNTLPEWFQQSVNAKRIHDLAVS